MIIKSKEQSENKELIYGIVFFPLLAVSAYLITSIWQLIAKSGTFGSILSQIAVDGMHILILLPSVILAFLFMWPIIKLIETLLPDK